MKVPPKTNSKFERTLPVLSSLEENFDNYCVDRYKFKPGNSPVKQLTKCQARPSTSIKKSKTLHLNLNEKSIIYIKHINAQQIHFSKRRNMWNSKLLLFHFEGVIGGFYQPCIWHRGTLSLYLRSDAINTLKFLLPKYRIVFLFKQKESMAQEAIKFLTENGVQIDAAYILLQNPWSKIPYSYDFIYKDFGIDENAKIVVIHTFVK